MHRFWQLCFLLALCHAAPPPWASDNGGWNSGPKSAPVLPHEARGDNSRDKDKEDLKTFWLIPRDPISCLASEKAQVIYVDKDKVNVQDCQTGSRTLRFPGCAAIRAEIQLLQELNTNLFANVQFQWQNLPAANSIKCENQEPNGCGGVGNNCYYCDVCKGIVQFQQEHNVKSEEEFQCPTKPKIYKLDKQFNVNDWSGLDSNGNGVIDLLEDDNLQKIRDYLKAIDVVGFGTLSIEFQLATNATHSQRTQKEAEEARIRSDVSKKYQNEDKSEEEVYREADNEVNYWHRNSYLPWLVKANQVACVQFIFDVCLNEPSPFNIQSSYQCV